MNRWFESKINTIATVALTANLLAVLGWLPPEVENLIVLFGNIAVCGLIIVFRTWFTAPK